VLDCTGASPLRSLTAYVCSILPDGHVFVITHSMVIRPTFRFPYDVSHPRTVSLGTLWRCSPCHLAIPQPAGISVV
jgi:hypothetical protein